METFSTFVAFLEGNGHSKFIEWHFQNEWRTWMISILWKAISIYNVWKKQRKRVLDTKSYEFIPKMISPFLRINVIENLWDVLAICQTFIHWYTYYRFLIIKEQSPIWVWTLEIFKQKLYFKMYSSIVFFFFNKCWFKTKKVPEKCYLLNNNNLTSFLCHRMLLVIIKGKLKSPY